MIENTPHKPIYCQRCEKEINDQLGVCLLSLPPHNAEDLQKLCFDCSVELAYLFSLEKKKKENESLNN